MLDHLETAGIDATRVFPGAAGGARSPWPFGDDPAGSPWRDGRDRRHSAASLPAARAVAVDTTVYHAAGADEVLDLAMALSGVAIFGR